jgi:hypothetical protein
VVPCLTVSSTDSAASVTAVRTSAKRGFCLVGFTRFVRMTTNTSFAGSIQIDVPVKPV